MRDIPAAAPPITHQETGKAMILLAQENAGKMLGMELADWLVLGVYFVLILWLGIWSARKVKDMTDFFMGGRRFGKVFMMFFAFGAGTSSEHAISVVAGSWRAGLAGIWWQFLWLWATPFYWIVAPVMRRMRALTTADFFEHRYNSSTALLYSVYGIAMATVFIAGGLYASGKMVNALTGGELDSLARDYDVHVPEFKWDEASSSFGAGTLLEFADSEVDNLSESDFQILLRKRFKTADHALPPGDATTFDITDFSGTIKDTQRDLTYPIAKAVVKEKNAQGDEVEKTTIRVSGSGWRRIQGFEYAIFAMTILFVAYGMAGGLGAAIITDFVQGILTITFSFLLLPFVFAKIGGFGSLHENEVKEGMFDLVASPQIAQILGREPITIFYVVMLSLTALIGIVVQPHIMGVCGAGKTEFEGRFGFTVGNFLKRFCTIAWTFTGLACIVWYLGADSPLKDSPDPAKREVYTALRQQADLVNFKAGVIATELGDEDVQKLDKRRNEVEGMTRKERNKQLGKELKALQTKVDALPADEKERINSHLKNEMDRINVIDKKFADELFGEAAYEIFPTIMPGLIGLLLASLLAAVMSTSDAQMIIGAGLFTENIYKRFLKKSASPRHYLWVGRLSGLMIVIFAVILQSSFTDVIHVLKVIVKTPAAIGISLWIGIAWRRFNPLAVWLSTLAALGTWALVAYFPSLLHIKDVTDFMFRFKGETQTVVKMTDAWQMFLYIGAGLVVGIGVSLLTKRQDTEKLDKFFALLHTPVLPDEVVDSPCTLPENPAKRTPKMFNHPDIELPKPTKLGMIGFAVAWMLVAGIIYLTNWLSKTL
jgi:Na+/proline symporter